MRNVIKLFLLLIIFIIYYFIYMLLSGPELYFFKN